MIQYLVKRVLVFIPTLFIISLLAFIISINAPGDPVERMLSSPDFANAGTTDQNAQRTYWQKKLGLDLPVFYFSVRPLAINQCDWKHYIPSISFHPDNQYHRWLFGDGIYSKGILRGDFGISYVTREPVWEILKRKIGWSLLFALLSVILAYAISIPTGIQSAINKGKRVDRMSALVFFILYSMPVFWVATLLLMTFANPDVLKIFPASGIKPVEGFAPGTSFFEKIHAVLPYMVLPLICFTYGSFAFLSRTMRVSMLEIINADYIRTAYAKGLSKKKVIYKHAFRNALFPLITVFANVFPFAVGGSVIIETVFTIPGMGFEIYSAIQNQDYPVIISVFTLTGLLTVAGYLLSDFLYAFADPRVSFFKKALT